MLDFGPADFADLAARRGDLLAGLARRILGPIEPAADFGRRRQGERGVDQRRGDDELDGAEGREDDATHLLTSKTICCHSTPLRSPRYCNPMGPNLIRLFDFYLAAMFLLGSVRRFG